MEPLVSVAWLYKNSTQPDLILLEAQLGITVNAVVEDTAGIVPNALLFDIETVFSDATSAYPHTLLPKEKFEAAAKKLGINRNSRIVVYDRIGVYSSPRVWWMFKVMGFSNVSVLNGGLPEWKQQGYPTVEKYSTPNREGDFVAHFEAGLVADTQEVLERSTDPDTVIIDARAADRFNGKTPEPRPGLRSGHIPGSVNLPFGSVLHQHRMLEPEVLSERFRPIADKEANLIFSCGSGVTACIIALAATVAGYPNSSVYDGSWSEWGADPKLPMAL